MLKIHETKELKCLCNKYEKTKICYVYSLLLIITYKVYNNNKVKDSCPE